MVPGDHPVGLRPLTPRTVPPSPKDADVMGTSWPAHAPYRPNKPGGATANVQSAYPRGPWDRSYGKWADAWEDARTDATAASADANLLTKADGAPDPGTHGAEPAGSETPSEDISVP